MYIKYQTASGWRVEECPTATYGRYFIPAAGSAQALIESKTEHCETHILPDPRSVAIIRTGDRVIATTGEAYLLNGTGTTIDKV